MQIVLGFLFSVPISVIAYYKQSLSKSGMIAGAFLGAMIYAFGGSISTILMMSFFISSSVLSKLKHVKKRSVEKLEYKGSRRDWIQVFANGGTALAFSFIYWYTNHLPFLVCVAISLAAATADTWGSEVGVLSKKPPVSIVSFKPVERGLSGGISIFGTFVSLLGSGFIATLFIILKIIVLGHYEHNFILFSIVTVFGFLGSLIDSYLGAVFQASYYDDENSCITEKKGKNKLVKGLPWMTNDMVNFLSIFLAVCLFSVFAFL